jgi:hypothetical protein
VAAGLDPVGIHNIYIALYTLIFIQTILYRLYISYLIGLLTFTANNNNNNKRDKKADECGQLCVGYIQTELFNENKKYNL